MGAERSDVVIIGAGLAGSAAAAAERWPGLRFGPDPVMFHPDGGVLDPERAMAAMRSIATARGAEFHDGTRVLRVEPREAVRACIPTTGPGRREW